MPSHLPRPFFAGRKRRALLAVLSLALLGGVGAVIFSSHAHADGAQSAQAAPPAPVVTVAPAEVQLVTDFEELVGRVDSRETVELRPRVSGHIEDIRFQAGEIVQKGDVLFVIDSRWYRAQFDLAAAKLTQAQALANIAEREAKRANDLHAAHAISAEEAEARRSRHDEARGAVAAAEAAVVSARLDLEHTEVRAPITGRISRALVTAGNLVSGSPGSGTPLATLVSVDDAYVYADVDELTVLKFNRLAREGRLASNDGRIPVVMQLSDEAGYPRQGYIESADNRLDPSTGALVLRMVFPNTDGALVPGLFARVRLPVSAPQKQLLISERAIGTDQSQKFVLTVGADKTVAYRSVKLGSSFQGKRVVRDGLKPGEQVVVNGLQRVRPGMTVTPQLAEAPSSPSGTQVAAK